MKLLVVSTHPHQLSGYAKVSYEIITRLAQTSHEITHFAFQKSYPANKIIEEQRKIPGNVRTINVQDSYPNNPGEFGFSILPKVINDVNPDIILLYNDLGIINMFLDHIDINRNVVAYVDQVYEAENNEMLSTINKRCKHIFVFSKYWEKCMRGYGNITTPITVIKHGTSKHMLFKLNLVELRTELGLPKDDIIFLNLNRNTPRKRHDLTILAFVELLKRCPRENYHLLIGADSTIYSDCGYDLQSIYRHQLYLHELDADKYINRIMYVKNFQTLSDSDVNKLYNACDIGLNSCNGEGVGLCNLEHGALGKPQIVSHVGGLRDFINATNSFPITPKHIGYTQSSVVGGLQRTIDPSDMANAMEKYLIAPDLIESHGKKLSEYILSNYDWDIEVGKLVTQLEFMVIDLTQEVEI